MSLIFVDLMLLYDVQTIVIQITGVSQWTRCTKTKGFSVICVHFVNRSFLAMHQINRIWYTISDSGYQRSERISIKRAELITHVRVCCHCIAREDRCVSNERLHKGLKVCVPHEGRHKDLSHVWTHWIKNAVWLLTLLLRTPRKLRPSPPGGN